MKHPGEADLALFAGHDLGYISEWRIGRHVSRCDECRTTVDEFEAARAESAALGDLPADLNWSRLASEMKANIRLGLAAGECVADHTAPKRRTFTGFQTLVAYAGLIIMVAAGVWLQRPIPKQQVAAAPAVQDGTTLAATQDGIELSEAGGSFGLRYKASRDVYYSADAGGGMRARYVDHSTGYVTVVKVNVE